MTPKQGAVSQPKGKAVINRINISLWQQVKTEPQQCTAAPIAYVTGDCSSDYKQTMAMQQLATTATEI